MLRCPTHVVRHGTRRRYSQLLRHTAPAACTQRSSSAVQRTGDLLNRWYAAGGGIDDAAHDAVNAADVFTPSVVTIRHITDLVTGARQTACMGIKDLHKQTPATFGKRSKYPLAEFHDPDNCISYIQSYEIIEDASGKPWRQSSIRVRVYDPLDGFKLRLGIIFHSERDELPNRLLHASVAAASRCKPALSLGSSGGATPRAAPLGTEPPTRCTSAAPPAALGERSGTVKQLVATPALSPSTKRSRSDAGTSALQDARSVTRTQGRFAR